MTNNCAEPSGGERVTEVGSTDDFENRDRLADWLLLRAYQEWLDAPAAGSMEYLRQYPADKLLATPKHPKTKTETPQPI